MSYVGFMTDSTVPAGPDPEAIATYITTTYPETDVVTIPGASFFALDAEKHFPNFATIVTTDDFDEGTPSHLWRPGFFRLNLGVSRATFNRLVESTEPPDYSVVDRFLPHPVYGRQLWVSILNPSEATFRELVIPLIGEAHDRLAAQRARRATGSS